MEGFPVWRTHERFITVDDYESKHGTFSGLSAMRLFVLPSRLVGYFPGLVVSNPVENPRYKQAYALPVLVRWRRWNLGNGGEAGGSCRQNRDGVGGGGHGK